ncbi:transketolase, partial [bacterium]|nr:transketolase [bacterium]
MENDIKSTLQKVALSIRSLSMDAIQKANSGHPGLPMGCAEIGSVLYGNILKFHHENLDWINRDRFVLSAGHGSMLLYSLLHLSNCDMNMEDLKTFRQLGSKTPGHPENFLARGVETTTGPLAQGLGAAVGMALAGKILAQKFNTPQRKIFDYTVFTLVGDGCVMEGLSNEVSSFAGHYQLDNLVVLYDSNDICLDGDLKECFSENVQQRFDAYGFDTKTIDGHSFQEIEEALLWAQNPNGRPKMIICKTQIGKGSPNKAGTSSVHGSPLGLEELSLARKNLGIPEEGDFYVAPGVQEFFSEVNDRNAKIYTEWHGVFSEWKVENPDLSEVLDQMRNPDFSCLEESLPQFTPGEKLAGRKSSQACIQVLAEEIPSLIGGSADLSCSDSTGIKSEGILTGKDFSARNIKFGVRELGMSGICSGMALTGFFTPFCGTFLTFSDYLRPSLRLNSLMGLKVTYQFTHESVCLGEDGPTHQAVEHAAALRTIPGCY